MVVLKNNFLKANASKQMIFLNTHAYRKRFWQVLELFLQRLHMIAVNMCVPDNMDKITWNKV
jgi:hypothetical protein